MTAGIAPFQQMPRVIGGRYGLSSKEFTPAMVKAVFDELAKERPKNHFTIGINDDVTHTSLDYDPEFSTEDPQAFRGLFYGLGSDGTVSANKNSIKIIGEETDNYAQGYFVYDSKKAGAVTISHLRFGPNPIHSSYLITKANFVACHQFSFLERFDVLKAAMPGATFLLNSYYGPDEVWDHLPRTVQRQIIEKKLRFYVIDAYKVAAETGMGSRINTIMQTCFFAISGILPREEAIQKIKDAIRKTWGKRGEAIVQKNFAAVDAALAHLHEVKVPDRITATFDIRPPVPPEAPEFVKRTLAPIIAGEGDSLPVSAFPPDGTFPTATAQWEKRNIALEIPVWDEELCIQCGKCVLVCPHATIRAKVYDPKWLAEAPPTFKHAPARWREFKDMKYTLQVAPEDCTGCGLCVEVCPVKSKTEVKHKALNMAPQPPLREQERVNWEFFLKIPDMDRRVLSPAQVKDNQLFRPLFEFSGACAGCGETPYIKLLTQLFGDRLVIGNATGCSSIYGGNLPTTPYCVDHNGRGPAWNNSLFEDTAEFALGIRLALNRQIEYARWLVQQLSHIIGDELAGALLNADQTTEKGIYEQRERVALLRQKLEGVNTREARDLYALADALVRKTVWGVGGDGWAYDIGYGGLDHVLASGENVNLLVLDTEVYSNTGGQMSKATPLGAVAKFAFGGKPQPKKDLAMMAMTYGNVYVARVAFGYNDMQTVKAFLEAEAYDGPSLIIAYCHCIAHGYDLVHGLDQQKAAVQSGYWPLFRYNPELLKQGKNPLQLDSKAPTLPLDKYIYNETRYSMLHFLDQLAGEVVDHHRSASRTGEGPQDRSRQRPCAAGRSRPRSRANEGPWHPIAGAGRAWPSSARRESLKPRKTRAPLSAAHARAPPCRAGLGTRWSRSWWRQMHGAVVHVRLKLRAQREVTHPLHQEGELVPEVSLEHTHQLPPLVLHQAGEPSLERPRILLGRRAQPSLERPRILFGRRAQPSLERPRILLGRRTQPSLERPRILLGRRAQPSLERPRILLGRRAQPSLERAQIALCGPAQIFHGREQLVLGGHARLEAILERPRILLGRRAQPSLERAQIALCGPAQIFHGCEQLVLGSHARLEAILERPQILLGRRAQPSLERAQIALCGPAQIFHGREQLVFGGHARLEAILERLKLLR
jgi:homodimeric pyruvate:ferredoxin (flavodoxin) oxidoreductase